MRRRDFITLVGGVAVGCPLGARAQQATVARCDARSGGRGPTVEQDIARWVVELRYEELPPDVTERAKRVLLGTLGCALGAIGAEPVRMAQQVVAMQGGNPQATILGIGRKAACDQAAFLNGMALRYFDYNDYVALGRPNHASINVAPALAVAEMQGLGGKALLLGLTAGYELEVRLRDAIAANRRGGSGDPTLRAQYASPPPARNLPPQDEVQ